MYTWAASHTASNAAITQNTEWIIYTIELLHKNGMLFHVCVCVCVCVFLNGTSPVTTPVHGHHYHCGGYSMKKSFWNNKKKKTPSSKAKLCRRSRAINILWNSTHTKHHGTSKLPLIFQQKSVLGKTNKKNGAACMSDWLLFHLLSRATLT